MLRRAGRLLETSPRAIAKFPVGGSGSTRLSVVAEIPKDANVLYYGVSYSGATLFWVDDVRVGAGTELPVTERSLNAPVLFPVNVAVALPAPTNLSFELTNKRGSIEEGCRRVRNR